MSTAKQPPPTYTVMIPWEMRIKVEQTDNVTITKEEYLNIVNHLQLGNFVNGPKGVDKLKVGNLEVSYGGFSNGCGFLKSQLIRKYGDPRK